MFPVVQCSNIVVLSNPNPYESATNNEGGLHFIFSDSGNYDFDVKLGHCGLLGFVKAMIDYEHLWCVFCFRTKEKEKFTCILYQLLFYNISSKMFFFFSLLELNSYNGYACNFIIVVSYDELIINKVL